MCTAKTLDSYSERSALRLNQLSAIVLFLNTSSLSITQSYIIIQIIISIPFKNQNLLPILITLIRLETANSQNCEVAVILQVTVTVIAFVSSVNI